MEQRPVYSLQAFINNAVQVPDDKLWTLNQQNADIREFIVQVAKITEETFVIDPSNKKWQYCYGYFEQTSNQG